MTSEPRSSRQRILSAATELALEAGHGNLSLEAIAAKAGLSKGGLLYNFPSKSKLLEAMVQAYLDEFDAALRAAEQLEQAPNATARAYLTIFFQKYAREEPPPAGILTALAEGLNFLDPIRCYNRTLLDRMTASGNSAEDAILVFLAVEGLRSMALFDTTVLTPAEREIARLRLLSLLDPKT